MALKSTIFKAELQIADITRHHYQDHVLTLARHPSETDERMMIRLLAFMLHADNDLQFGRGLSTEDEPDLWQKDLTGAITSWIDVGQPDDRRIMKACGRAGAVVLYTYGTSAGVWWKQIAGKVERARNLSVFHIAPSASQALAKLAQRTMRLHCTIQDGQAWIGADGADALQIEVSRMQDKST